jgi:hypothetical protein
LPVWINNHSPPANSGSIAIECRRAIFVIIIYHVIISAFTAINIIIYPVINNIVSEISILLAKCIGRKVSAAIEPRSPAPYMCNKVVVKRCPSSTPDTTITVALIICITCFKMIRVV